MHQHRRRPPPSAMPRYGHRGTRVARTRAVGHRRGGHRRHRERQRHGQVQRQLGRLAAGPVSTRIRTCRPRRGTRTANQRGQQLMHAGAAGARRYGSAHARAAEPPAAPAHMSAGPARAGDPQLAGHGHLAGVERQGSRWWSRQLLRGRQRQPATSLARTLPPVRGLRRPEQAAAWYARV